jgi:hypothetical protein
MTNPIATSTCASIAGSNTFRKRHFHSPVVMAMITNNRMSNCRDVTAMMKECQSTGSHDRVCQVASQYINMCMNTDDASN